MATGYQGLPAALDLTRDSLRKIAVAVNNLLAGKTNNVTSITLADGETSTTITDSRIGAGSHLSLTPLTANAAAIVDSVYVSARGKQTATITHSSTANEDQEFSLAIIG